MRPQSFEFSLYPVAGFARVVLPNKLIVERPARVGFVGAAKKTGMPAVSVANDASLAMNEPEGVIGKDTYIQLRVAHAREESMQARDTFGAAAREFFGIILEERELLGLLGGHDILGLDIGIADNAYGAGNAFERLSGQLEQGRIKVARDAVVGYGTYKPFRQELRPDCARERWKT